MSVATTSKLGSGRLLAYALPAISLQAMLVPILLTLPPLYAQEVGLSVSVISIVLILARALEAISDPLIGALSDRSRPGPWQRAGWMVAGTPVAVASGIALLHPVAGAGPLYLFVCLVIFYLGWTMVYIPYQSWGVEMSEDFAERSRIAGFREAGSFLGYLLSALVPLIALVVILGQSAPTYGDQAKATGWFFTFSLPLFVFLCVKFVPRGVHGTRDAHIPWSQMIRLVRRNKPFMRLLIAYVFDRLALGIHFALLPFFMQYGLDMLAAFLTLSVAISIAPILSIPVWLGLARRFGKHRVYCVANIITAAGYASLYVVPHGALALLLVLSIVRGFGNAATAVLPASMTADAVDYDEWRSGVRQAGAHMAFLTFVQKLGLAGGALGLAFVSWFGFRSAAGTHTVLALQGVRIGTTLLPGLLLVPSVALMWNFSLDERRHRILRRRLERRHLVVTASAFAAAMVAAGLLIAPPAFGGTDPTSQAKPLLTLDALRAKYADRTGHLADIDGLQVYYKDEGSGPAILMVHGSASTLKTYDGVAARLRTHYRVIRYDVPGQGLSADVSDEASRLQPAQVAVQLLAKLGITRVTAVGVSSGGTLCIQLAALRPDLVKRLIVSNAPADPVDTSHLRQPQAFLDAQREARDSHFQSRDYWKLFLTYFAGEPDRMTPAIIEQYYDFNRRAFNGNFIALVAKVADHAKSVDAMQRVSAPTLLLWGARDPLLTPAAADILAGYLTHAPVSTLLLPDVGHYPPLEVPERFADLVATFIETVTPLEPRSPPPEER